MRLTRIFPALLAALLAALLVPTAARAEPRVEGRRLSVEAGDAQAFVQERFPQTHDTLGGLLRLTVSNPTLELPPGTRMQLALDLAAATAGAAPSPVGRVRLSSALRYDPAARAFFLDQPAIEDFRPARAGLELDAGTRGLLNTWLADYARTEPVYRIEPPLAAMLGGIQVESAGVKDGRLYVLLDRDPGIPAAE